MVSHKKGTPSWRSGFLNVSEEFFRHVWTVECGLSALFTPVEPLADEVEGDSRYDIRRDGHQER